MPAGLAAGQSAKTGPASVVAVSMHLAAERHPPCGGGRAGEIPVLGHRAFKVPKAAPRNSPGSSNMTAVSTKSFRQHEARCHGTS
jgi:hypothetical protein